MRTPKMLRALYEPANVFAEVAAQPKGFAVLAACVFVELLVTRTSALAALWLRQRHQVLGLAQSLWAMFAGAFTRPAFLLALVAAALYALQHKAEKFRLDVWQSFCIACYSYPAHTAFVVTASCLQAFGIPLPGWLQSPFGAFVWLTAEMLPSTLLLYAGITGNRQRRWETPPPARARLVLAACIGATLLGLGAQSLRVQSDWAVARPPIVGDPFPAFAAVTAQGEPWHSDALQGHVALVDFWATWCAPCVRSLPRLQSLSDTFEPRGLSIVALNVEPENPTGVQKFWTDQHLRLPFLQDPGPARSRFAVQGLPTAFLIDRQGIVRHISQGPPDWREIERLVEALSK